MNYYRQLLVWQKTMQLISNVYELTRDYPRTELFGLTQQTRRAAVSIASNIAEGQGRLAPAECRQFMGTARGSVYEVETQLLIAVALGFVDQLRVQEALMQADEISRMLTRMAWSLKRQIDTRSSRKPPSR